MNITVEQASKLLDVSESTVRRHLEAGRLKRIDDGIYCLSLGDVTALRDLPKITNCYTISNLDTVKFKQAINAINDPVLAVKIEEHLIGSKIHRMLSLFSETTCDTWML